MATKKQIVKELIKLGVEDTESNLMKKNVETLEAMLEDNREDATPQVQAIDMEALKAQMMAELKAEMEAKVRKELMEEMKVEKPVVPVLRKADIDKNKMIPIMNITAFGLVYLSPRSGAEWNWTQYGDIEYMEMQELITMRSGQRRFLDEPFILIMDDEAVAYLGLEKAYEQMIEPSNIDRIFKMKLDDYKNVIDSSPRGIQILIINRAKQLIESGELDSAHKVKFLNEKFGTDLIV